MMEACSDQRRFAPATARNREPILAVLRDELPDRGMVLEIGSGSGEHCAYFAGHFPALTWQPSDADPAARDSIAAWTGHAGAENISAPLAIDAAAVHWPIDHADAMFCANVIHIAPWEVCAGLFAGAARILAPAGRLILYGPFIQPNMPTAPGNLAFDRQLRAQDPNWGVRNLAAVTDEAERNGLKLIKTVGMPANNLIVVIGRSKGAP